SESVTLISVALSTTWLLVTTFPAPSMMMPDPVPATGPGIPGPGKSGACPGSKKNRRKDGGRLSDNGFPRGLRSRSATGGRPARTSIRTTLVATALAVAANALERFFATSGDWVRGVIAARAAG